MLAIWRGTGVLLLAIATANSFPVLETEDLLQSTILDLWGHHAGAGVIMQTFDSDDELLNPFSPVQDLSGRGVGAESTELENESGSMEGGYPKPVIVLQPPTKPFYIGNRPIHMSPGLIAGSSRQAKTFQFPAKKVKQNKKKASKDTKKSQKDKPKFTDSKTSTKPATKVTTGSDTPRPHPSLVLIPPRHEFASVPNRELLPPTREFAASVDSTKLRQPILDSVRPPLSELTPPVHEFTPSTGNSDSIYKLARSNTPIAFSREFSSAAGHAFFQLPSRNLQPPVREFFRA